MDGSADSALTAALTPVGRTNFSAECTVGATAARAVMNETHVALAVADERGTLLTDQFTDVTAVQAPETAEVSLRIGGRELSVVFPDEAQAQRFVRVLGVRQEAVSPPRRANRPGAGLRAATKPARPTPRSRYLQWMQNTLLASTVLLALGWLDLIVGAILTVVVAINDGGAAALLWLVLAVAGSAVPFCLGSLARVVVYRYELEDARRAPAA